MPVVCLMAQQTVVLEGRTELLRTCPKTGARASFSSWSPHHVDLLTLVSWCYEIPPVGSCQRVRLGLIGSTRSIVTFEPPVRGIASITPEANGVAGVSISPTRLRLSIGLPWHSRPDCLEFLKRRIKACLHLCNLLLQICFTISDER